MANQNIIKAQTAMLQGRRKQAWNDLRDNLDRLSSEVRVLQDGSIGMGKDPDADKLPSICWLESCLDAIKAKAQAWQVANDQLQLLDAIQKETA